MISALKIYVFFFLCIISINSTKAQKSESINILFIGNSLTYTNDLPILVKKEGEKLGFKIKTSIIAKPNYAIVDHLKEGSIQKKTSKKEYDFIIVQQGPSSQLEGRNLLIESGKEINKLIKGTKTKLVYFMVWPSLNNYRTFDGVIKNHKDAAKLNNALLCPVGEVWKNHFDVTNNFGYYSTDGFHPSMKGSEKSAEVIVKTLFN